MNKLKKHDLLKHETNEYNTNDKSVTTEKKKLGDANDKPIKVIKLELTKLSVEDLRFYGIEMQNNDKPVKNTNKIINLNGTKSGFYIPNENNEFIEDDLDTKNSESDNDQEPFEESFEINTDAKFKCLICMKPHPSRNRLRIHMTTYHTGVKHECDKCEKQFTSINRFRKHACENKATKSFHCYKCGKGFDDFHNLKWHVDKFHNQNYLRCKKCFTKYQNIRDHLQHSKVCFAKSQLEIKLTQLNELELLKYDLKGFKQIKNLNRCEMCAKSFTMASNLKRHMELQHVEEMKHYCKNCPKSFKHLRSLNDHVTKFHKPRSANLTKKFKNGRMNYECRDCKKLCPSMRHLKKHMKIIHG